LHQAYGRNGVTLVGVSQNGAKDTNSFAREFGVTFPLLLDDPSDYAVSNAYGLTNVPTVFWIAQDGEIEISSVGWVKVDFEQLNSKMAEAGKAAPAPIFQPGEDVRAYRAG
jgi:peroxiredoxin